MPRLRAAVRLNQNAVFDNHPSLTEISRCRRRVHFRILELLAASRRCTASSITNTAHTSSFSSPTGSTAGLHCGSNNCASCLSLLPWHAAAQPLAVCYQYRRPTGSSPDDKIIRHLHPAPAGRISPSPGMDRQTQHALVFGTCQCTS